MMSNVEELNRKEAQKTMDEINRSIHAKNVRAEKWDEMCKYLVKEAKKLDINEAYLTKPDTWRKDLKPYSEYLRDNPEEFDRIRAEVEAEDAASSKSEIQDFVDTEEHHRKESQKAVDELPENFLNGLFLTARRDGVFEVVGYDETRKQDKWVCLTYPDKVWLTNTGYLRGYKRIGPSAQKYAPREHKALCQRVDEYLALAGKEDTAAARERIREAYEEFRKALYGPPSAPEPQCVFPESDDDLVQEMFQVDSGTILTALCKPPLPGGKYTCVSKSGHTWDLSAKEIRKHTSLGPSLEKLRLRALERIAGCVGDDLESIKGFEERRQRYAEYDEKASRSALSSAYADFKALENQKKG